MLLRNKDTGEEFHSPSGLGKALIATGTVEEVIPLPIGPEVEVTWLAERGQMTDDYRNPPVIRWFGGGNSGYHASTDGTSHLKCKSYVPGLKQQTCPQHVAELYLQLYKEWASKRKQPVAKERPPQVSAATPKIPGVSPWSGATAQPWRQGLEFREKNK